MNKLLKNIHLLFWGFIPIFLLYGFLNYENYIDINIHETMFVIAIIHVMILASFIFLIIGLGYYLSYKSEKFKPLNSLTFVHVLITFIGLLLLFFIPEYQYKLPVESHIDIKENLDKSEFYYNIKLYAFFGVFSVQLLYLINIIISIFRR